MRIFLILLLFLTGCREVWNSPYPVSERGENILYSAFIQRPKHLDPVQSYTSDESIFTRQVMEPPLQYHYLKRPYELIPLTAVEVPKPREIEGGKFTVYEIRIRPGIRYQPHPAFVEGNLNLSAREVEALATPYALPLGTRELVADDYVYQIKRLAHPRLHSPILGLMSEYIVGLGGFARHLQKIDPHEGWLDLRRFPLEGVQAIDRYTYRVTLKGSYPQFAYWLAMPFFSPIPWEVEKFFHQEGMAARNFTLDWWPVGTGPYMLVENDPNQRMVLERNPNYRRVPYPSEGEPGDEAAGLLRDAGKPLPFIDRLVFSREKESVPYWNKFLQGYYDTAGIASDNFDQAVRLSVGGAAEPSPEMAQKGIRLATSVAAATYYFGFNMKDPVVGARAGERGRKLRQAISIAVDMEEYLSIFQNGRGVVAHSPIPPGIFGRREGAEGVNPVTHVWRDGRAERRPLDAARRLLAEAGYPNGRDARSGAPLVLYFDTVARGPGDKARLDWWRRQFSKLGIQLEARETDWNRFQEKIRNGTQQVFGLGWLADYPDPENFLFLLHGPQARADGAGSNSANYVNAEFDALFERMKAMPSSPERQALIDRMVAIARRDAPWIFGFHPKEYTLRHAWLANVKPNDMAGNTYQYLRLDPAAREAARAAWNQPVLWPAGLVLLALAASAVPAVRTWRRRERMAAKPAA